MSQLVYLGTKKPDWAPLILSATQIGNLKDCFRSWAWRIIKRVKSPSTAAQERGSTVHELVQGYNLTGQWKDDPLTPIAKRLILHQPAFNPKPEDVEHRFYFSYKGIVYVCIIDLHVPHMRMIIDYKTTSNMMYAKKPEQLQEDTQAILYSVGALAAHGYIPQCRWIYTTTRGKRDSRAITIPEVYNLQKKMDGIHEIAVVMHKLYEQQVDPLSLKPNVRSCGKYGGCSYQDLCNLTARERMVGAMAQQSFKEALTMFNQTSEQTINPPTQQPAQPALPEKQELDQGTKDFLLQRIPVATMAGMSPEQLKQTAAQTYRILLEDDWAVDLVAFAKAQVAPEQPKPQVNMNVTVKKPQEKLSKAEIFKKLKEKVEETKTLPTDDELKEVFKFFGYSRTQQKTRDEMAEKLRAVLGEQPTAAPSVSLEKGGEPVSMTEEQQQPQSTPNRVSNTKTLYINCMPTRGIQAEELSGIIEPYKALGSQALNVVDFRLIPYREGSVTVANLIQKAVLSGELVLPDHCRVSMYAEEKEIITAVEAMVDVVVRAI